MSHVPSFLLPDINFSSSAIRPSFFTFAMLASVAKLFARSLHHHRRGICFDESVGKHLLYKKVRSASTSGWQSDNIHAGSQLKIGNEVYLVLCRTSPYACIVENLGRYQVFTLRVRSLPAQPRPASKECRQHALDKLMELFNLSSVKKIDIRMPWDGKGPQVYNTRKDEFVEDSTHPYMIVHYKDKDICLAFPCTTTLWASTHAPHIKMLVADPKRSPMRPLWDRNMIHPTAVDLSRMASFPKQRLDELFQPPRSTAILLESVLDGATQVIMCNAQLSHVRNEELFDAFDEEGEPPCTLVIVRNKVAPIRPCLCCPDATSYGGTGW